MAEMTEAKIYEALGLEVPAQDTGANGQEPAAPAQPQTEPASTDTGANGQEIADPAQDDAAYQTGIKSNSQDPADEQDDGDIGADGGNQPQTPEERRANAARRRQQEQQQAVDAAVAAARREEQEKAAAAVKDLFEKTGMKNTITGKPIRTIAELEEWQGQMKRAQLEKDLKAGKLTTEGLTQLIGDHPDVKQAKELARQQDDAKAAQDKAAAQARIDGEIAEIGKMDPTIKSAKDLLNMPKAKEFYAYVQKGYSFIDAYRLANFEEITRHNADAARQQAQTSARSKQHLTVTGNSRSTGAASVPAEELKLYRMLNPGVSEADIQKHFNKYRKKGG